MPNLSEPPQDSQKFPPGNSDIFSKFSEMAKKVLINSQKIAQNMQSGIGSEHLLLGLVSTPGTLAYDMLKEHLINSDQIKLVLSLRGLHTRSINGISPEVKKILKLAVKIAAEFEHFSIDAEHILLAIVKEKQSLGYQIIYQIGVDPSHIKQQIERLFEELREMDQMIQKRIDTEPLGTPGGTKLSEEEIEEEYYPAPPSPFVMPKTASRKSSILDYFATDLTFLASRGKLDPIIGREKEIIRAVQILCRKTKNNPVLLGDPGVGKTAIVEGLAYKIINREVPSKLQNKRVLMLDMTLLVAGTMYRGQFEERIKKLIEEIQRSDNVILFIDELHTIVGAGSAEGSMDAANIFKPALAKGQLRLVGATTLDEYRRFIEKDSALERRLQPILVSEPTVDETIEILKGLKEVYEKYHNTKITDSAIEAAANLSKRYIQDRFLPDKAIDLIDEAAAATQMPRADSKSEEQDEIKKLYRKLEQVIAEKEKAVLEENFAKAAKLKELEKDLKTEIEKSQTREESASKRLIDSDNIAQIVSLWTGIPLINLVKEERERFLHLEKMLSEKIVGQKEAIFAVSSAIRRSKSGISNPNRPIGSFMFLGPTGVGKTETAKAISQVVFGKESALVKIDMSEFMERHNVSRLVGAPPGYIGYEEAGKLTETVRRNPYTLILFDEIEKAHPEIFNILLQILEDGYLTDAKGRKVNFKNTIIILTSNIGVEQLNKAAIGFQGQKKSAAEKGYLEIKEKVISSLKESFRPEFLNRLDKIIVFHPLTPEDIAKIVKIQLQELEEKLAAEKITLKIDEKLIQFIAQKGFDPEFGARPVRRAISDYLEDQLSEKILEGKFKESDTVLAKVEKDKVVFSKR